MNLFLNLRFMSWCFFSNLEVGCLDRGSTDLAAENILNFYINLGIFVDDRSITSYQMKLSYFKVVSSVPEVYIEGVSILAPVGAISGVWKRNTTALRP